MAFIFPDDILAFFRRWRRIYKEQRRGKEETREGVHSHLDWRDELENFRLVNQLSAPPLSRDGLLNLFRDVHDFLAKHLPMDQVRKRTWELFDKSYELVGGKRPKEDRAKGLDAALKEFKEAFDRVVKWRLDIEALECHKDLCDALDKYEGPAEKLRSRLPLKLKWKWGMKGLRAWLPRIGRSWLAVALCTQMAFDQLHNLYVKHDEYYPSAYFAKIESEHAIFLGFLIVGISFLAGRFIQKLRDAERLEPYRLEALLGGEQEESRPFAPAE